MGGGNTWDAGNYGANQIWSSEHEAKSYRGHLRGESGGVSH